MSCGSSQLVHRALIAFFLGGVGNPTSVLAGFDPKTLSTAFNATYEELAKTLLVPTRGPIVFYATEPGSGGEEHGRQEDGGDKGSRSGQWRPGGRGEDEEEECGSDEPSTWSWRKLMGRFLGGASCNAAQPNGKKDKTVRAPDAYNIYDHEPGFRNTYGWSAAVDKHAYEPLDHSDIGVYLVNLTAGSMMAPHVNPRATEYGVVLGGEGIIQVVFPNGTLAMSATVRAGDVFWIPRYFPFCQVASRGGPFEFFGFTTSARRNRPQFLAGSTSVLRAMLGPELAEALGSKEKLVRELVLAQKDGVILPSLPEKKRWEKPKEQRGEPLVIKQVARS